jgi:quinolinate synthase
MTPDKNLAQYAQRKTGRNISYWEGYCPVHNNLRVERVLEVKKAHPDAPFLAHPECPPEILDLADGIKSTSGILSYAARSKKREIIIGTEVGIIHPLSKANPQKTFIPADPGMICRDMKKIGLPQIQLALENMGPEVRVPEKIRVRAKAAVERMLAIPAK